MFLVWFSAVGRLVLIWITTTDFMYRLQYIVGSTNSAILLGQYIFYNWVRPAQTALKTD